MRNKGFTLIELIGVIILISIMVLIIVPSVDKVIKKGQTTVDNKTKDNIVLAARNWALDNKDKLPTEVNLTTLENEGYIEVKKELKNACVDISVNENGKTYSYKYVECKGE